MLFGVFSEFETPRLGVQASHIPSKCYKHLIWRFVLQLNMHDNHIVIWQQWHWPILGMFFSKLHFSPQLLDAVQSGFGVKRLRAEVKQVSWLYAAVLPAHTHTQTKYSVKYSVMQSGMQRKGQGGEQYKQYKVQCSRSGRWAVMARALQCNAQSVLENTE